jgi:GTP-binding protein
MPDLKVERVCQAPSQFPPPGLPEVAVIGRSNVGKSSLINKVFRKRGLMRVSNTPGRTQAVIFARLGEKGWVVDLPGFGYAKVPLGVKASWAKLVESYLARPTCAGAILLVDVRRDAGPGETKMVEYFRHYGRKFSVVMTKCDKVSRGQWKPRAQAWAEQLGLSPEEMPIPFSAVSGEGSKTVLRKFEETME